MTILKSTTLHSTENGSDKLYIAQVIAHADGTCSVEFQNGRRGGTLRAGTKTPAPVSAEQACDIYEKLVKSKLRGGYTLVEGDSDSAQVVGLERAGRDTGLRPQLLVARDVDTAADLIADGRFLMQPKHDGERRMLVLEVDGAVIGVNRSGLIVALPGVIVENAAGLRGTTGRTVIDGEQIGDTFIAFDLIEEDGVDLRALGAQERFKRLAARVPQVAGQATINRTSCWPTPAGRHAAFQTLREAGAEGVVFKDRHAPYQPVRDPAAIKCKFIETATVRVIGAAAGKRSVSLELMDPVTALWTAVGNVTVPANQAMPEAGAIVEVAYLYFTGPGGALFQPVLRGARTDVGPEACVLDQLKHKVAAGDLAA